MATLQGQEIKDTYQALLKTDGNTNIDGTLQTITDGQGNASALALSTEQLFVSGAISNTTSFENPGWYANAGGTSGSQNLLYNSANRSIYLNAYVGDYNYQITSSLVDKYPAGNPIVFVHSVLGLLTGSIESSYFYNGEGSPLTIIKLTSDPSNGTNDTFQGLNYPPAVYYDTTIYSVNFGTNNVASYWGHTEGLSTTTKGQYSHAEGYSTIASGSWSHAEGYQTRAIGDWTHTEGETTTAIGFGSHAEGLQTKAIRNYSHAEGYVTTANGNSSHAEGRETTTVGLYSHTEGYLTTAIGESSHAEGRLSKATGIYSHAEGYFAISSGSYSHAEGFTTIASGSYSHAEGSGSLAIGVASHAEGYNTTSIGPSSHTEGENTVASGPFSHAEGYYGEATGFGSHAEGYQTYAYADFCHAEGDRVYMPSVAAYAHGEGYGGYVSASHSHVEGHQTTTMGYASHAEGNNTKALGSLSIDGTGIPQHAEGRWNIPDTASLLIVGNGTANNARKNAFAITTFGTSNTTASAVYTQVSESLNFTNDAAAASAGVPLGGVYRSGSFLLIRMV